MTPERPKSFRFYHFCRELLLVHFRLFHGAKFIHHERVPKTGACLIVANHQSFYDPPLVGCRIRHRALTFLARASLFKSSLFGGLIARVNAIPIRDGEGDIRAIRDIIERLKKGEAVVIFPEGSRTFDGAMEPFRDGASLIIRKANCLVIPVAVEGAFDAWSRIEKKPKLGRRVMVMYGKPIPPEELDKNINARIEREIDDMRLELRAELRRMTGGSYPSPGPADHSFGSSEADSSSTASG
ncbi:MAG: lysophospholipid acyltransferase family protein [Phycisphaerales bacterium]